MVATICLIVGFIAGLLLCYSKRSALAAEYLEARSDLAYFEEALKHAEVELVGTYEETIRRIRERIAKLESFLHIKPSQYSGS